MSVHERVAQPTTDHIQKEIRPELREELSDVVRRVKLIDTPANRQADRRTNLLARNVLLLRLIDLKNMEPDLGVEIGIQKYKDESIHLFSQNEVELSLPDGNTFHSSLDLLSAADGANDSERMLDSIGNYYEYHDETKDEVQEYMSRTYEEIRQTERAWGVANEIGDTDIKMSMDKLRDSLVERYLILFSEGLVYFPIRYNRNRPHKKIFFEVLKSEMAIALRPTPHMRDLIEKGLNVWDSRRRNRTRIPFEASGNGLQQQGE